MIIDYAKPIDGAQLVAAGVTGVVRYWPKEHGSTVVAGLSRGELTNLAGHGLAIATVYEDTAADWMVGGYPAGVAAGQWLQGQFNAVDWVPRVVYLAADSNTLPATTVTACLDGAASVLGRDIVGLYGFHYAVQAAQAGGHANWFWLCGHYAPQGMHLYQCNGSQPSGPTNITVAGQTCDVDIAIQQDWGQAGGTVILGHDDLSAIVGQQIGVRPDGSPISLADALVNLYLGAYYGGGDAGTPAGQGVFRTVAMNQSTLSAMSATVAATDRDVQTDVQAVNAELGAALTQLEAAIRAEGTAQVSSAALQTALKAANIPQGIITALAAVFEAKTVGS